jgi:PncC family amidohydrolase
MQGQDALHALAERVATRLKERGETVAVAESATGGAISAALLAVPGASAYFLGGAVVYTRQARRALLAIADGEMTGMRAASEPYAALLARSVRDRLGSSWGVAESGAAGPSGNRYGDPAGHSAIAVAGARAHTLTLRTQSADRRQNMQAFAMAALQALLRAIEG